MTLARFARFLPTDLRLGLRLMARQPILTLTATVSLAVGIALATVGFAFMEAVLFSRLPFQNGDRFVQLRVFEEPRHVPARLAPESYAALCAGATTLEHLGALAPRRENATLPSGDVVVVATDGITPTSLRYLPWAPVQGRLLVPADGAPGAPPVDIAHEDVAAFKWFSAALAGIGAITLILALAGVYAMMALVVTRRTREIGIRVALGAPASRLVATIVGRAAWQVGIGGALGAGLAVASLAARNVLVSRLGTGGPWTLPLVVSLLVLAGLAATWLPLRRALRVRPSDALRAE